MKILLRLTSDVTIKSDKIRARFVTRLIRNMEAAFAAAGIAAEIERAWSRLFVVTDDARALDVLGRIFGLSSYSPVVRECGAELAEIVAVGVETFAAAVKGKTFAVRAKRTGHHAYTSMHLAKTLGGALWAEARGVALKNPEVEVNVEVRDQRAYLYSKRFRGAGGLPLGVGGRVLCLMSGGFDSAVAAWLMQKRGLEIDFVFCNLAGGAYERSVVGIAKFIQSAWSSGSRTYIHVLDFQPVVAGIRAAVRPAFAQVVLKRLFYRAAERVGARIGALATVTGECIGQVSSQTLQNLAAIDAAATLPVFRPVIGFDKEEIVALARRIGTADMCAAVQEYCQLVPDKPVTACTKERLDEEEAKVDPALLEAAVMTRRVHHLPDLSASDLAADYIYADAIPADAVVIDCREEQHFAAWHHPGAVHCELHELLLSFRRLDKAKTYLLYCPVGLQSAVAAEAMQKAGWQAYSLRGGMRSLPSSPPSA